MREERPIVFTITQDFRGYDAYHIVTKDTRAMGRGAHNFPARQVFEQMTKIATELNNKGYAVLFEVD